MAARQGRKRHKKTPDAKPQQSLTPVFGNSFKKDLKLIKKRNWDIKKLKDIIECLARAKPLPEKFKDHALNGNWQGFRDCHVSPDWILIYRTTKTHLYLTRTGTHSDLF